jgi:hypothetical protein
VKDVRFFLKAYEADLTEAADSTLQLHLCAAFRTRIRYILSQICEHFNLKEVEDVCLDLKESDHVAMAETLQPVTQDELDSAYIPPFEWVRGFMFDGDPYSALKETIKNYTKTRETMLKK